MEPTGQAAPVDCETCIPVAAGKSLAYLPAVDAALVRRFVPEHEEDAGLSVAAFNSSI
ncbi:hypothetical protein SAMN05421505_1705 [Sinosporangium album]|uniref:FXSXX-COOH protein n=1 Tax=Sinosporangium album TaxID=504805 RepID=A0A1G8LKH2_9ACTN|nr:hypothetical protein [Sinosporangium album]SDI56219.1 hypothetical protein SAMN05421505_1705 [Sinosporangium album]